MMETEENYKDTLLAALKHHALTNPVRLIDHEDDQLDIDEWLREGEPHEFCLRETRANSMGFTDEGHGWLMMYNVKTNEVFLTTHTLASMNRGMCAFGYKFSTMADKHGHYITC
jgi:hypothetical protein